MTDPAEIESDEEEIDEESVQEVQMVEVEAREMYDPIRCKFDMSKIRATDIKTNQRVIMPAPRPTKEECRLEVRTELMKTKFREYKEEFCDEKGEQRQKSLDKQELLGLKDIKKRLQDGEVVIKETDKSHKLCVNSVENYTKQGVDHIGDD